MAIKAAKKPAKKAPSVARGERAAAKAQSLKLAVEAILANQERAKKLYQRVAEDMATLCQSMRPGQTVETRFGTVALQDAFADGKLTAFKNTAIARYSLRVVG